MASRRSGRPVGRLGPRRHRRAARGPAGGDERPELVGRRSLPARGGLLLFAAHPAMVPRSAPATEAGLSRVARVTGGSATVGRQAAYSLGVARNDRPTRPTGARSALPSLRSSTRRAMRPSGPPTDEIQMWTTPDRVDRDTAQAVIDLALRAGVAMLATGASAADVTATVLMLTKAYGLSSVHVDVTYTSLTVSYHRGPHADPMTVMRIVPFRSQDFTRLERLRELILALTHETLPLDDARVRFDGVVSSPHPYRRWLVTGAGGVLAAGAAALVGAGPFIVLVSFVTALVVGPRHVVARQRGGRVVLRAERRRGHPDASWRRSSSCSSRAASPSSATCRPRSSSPRASSCCSPGCRWSAPPRTRWRATTSRPARGPSRSSC